MGSGKETGNERAAIRNERKAKKTNKMEVIIDSRTWTGEELRDIVYKDVHHESNPQADTEALTGPVRLGWEKCTVHGCI